MGQGSQARLPQNISLLQAMLPALAVHSILQRNNTKKNAANAKVTCSVSIGARDGGGFALAVKMHIEDKSLSQADLTAFVKEAHEKICPYSHATRNNIEVTFEVVES